MLELNNLNLFLDALARGLFFYFLICGSSGA